MNRGRHVQKKGAGKNGAGKNVPRNVPTGAKAKGSTKKRVEYLLFRKEFDGHQSLSKPSRSETKKGTQPIGARERPATKTSAPRTGVSLILSYAILLSNLVEPLPQG
ncbi:hypothetical protein BSKO_08056 [Bryopsis sp. KO-2023]|nr:hypothetical protein BSKO_08056 [Bryopsis sp. KO-2023]